MRNYTQETIGVTAKRVIEGNPCRTAVGIANVSGAPTVYIGSDSQLTIGNGFPIYPGTQITFNQGNGDRPDVERWLVADAPGADIRIIEEYGGR